MKMRGAQRKFLAELRTENKNIIAFDGGIERSCGLELFKKIEIKPERDNER